MSLHLGFTGTQVGMTDHQRNAVTRVVAKLATLYDLDVHHGDCVGADAEFDEICRGMQVRRFIHPPDSFVKRAICSRQGGDFLVHLPKPYLERNTDIVRASYVVLATPKERDEQQRSGTWSTIRRAVKLRKSVLIIYPDGTFTWRGEIYRPLEQW